MAACSSSRRYSAHALQAAEVPQLPLTAQSYARALPPSGLRQGLRRARGRMREVLVLLPSGLRQGLQRARGRVQEGLALLPSGLRQGLRRARARMREGLARQEEDPQVVNQAGAEGRGGAAPAQHAADESKQRPALEPHAARAAVALVGGSQVWHLRMASFWDLHLALQTARAWFCISSGSNKYSPRAV